MNRNRLSWIATALLTATFSQSLYATELNTLEKRYSYTLGYSIMQNILAKHQDLEPGAFQAAIQDALQKKSPQMNRTEMQEALNNYNQKQMALHEKLANKNKEDGKKFLEDFKKKPGVKELKNGIYYRIITAGKGPLPKETSTVSVHYEGKHVQGGVFDSSYARKEPTQFPVNGVIQGWQIALQAMPTGSKWEVAIPGELAYGERGTNGPIGPNETLLFTIELLEIK